MEKIKIKRIAINVCEMCLEGRGEECHVPTCYFFLRDVPDAFYPAFDHRMYDVLEEFEVETNDVRYRK